ncbi:hypothetical protein SCORR_v1c05400 [Spiroplasma corruscae]|uniref:Uncharacterized protein n=1 Tax=Spiroplasma corruscae TaxID=216934 RepID=A0A222EPA2_9MOLU|nr:hypothetical protein [Spiroplasma corruscae]ASP28312.1 hypothetical protein SCORR_v1c05400 [Spiroplasma corruscae]
MKRLVLSLIAISRLNGIFTLNIKYYNDQTNYNILLINNKIKNKRFSNYNKSTDSYNPTFPNIIKEVRNFRI